MLDVGALNAFTIFTAQHPDYMNGVPNARRLFIKELAKELIMPHMNRRMETSVHLRRNVTEAMATCGVKRGSAETTHPQEDLRQGGKSKRKRCSLCPTARDRKVTLSCSKCTRPICKDHSVTVVICDTCKNWDCCLGAFSMYTCLCPCQYNIILPNQFYSVTFTTSPQFES